MMGYLKLGKKQPNTPRSRIKSAIRMLWMRSRERAKVLKEAGYCCSECGVKQTKPKNKEDWVSLEVHHLDGIDCWEEIISLIATKILESEQIALCKPCHKIKHEKVKA